MTFKRKKLALVNYHDPFFWPFAQRLQSDGFQVYWINSRPISSEWIRSQGISAEQVCDVLEGPQRINDLKKALDILSEYEQDLLPTVNSIIFMDQNLRNADYESAVFYLAESAARIREFIVKNDIQCVSSGRDTALQMMTMLVCKRLDVWWGCVTRPKLPKEWFGFSPTHQGDEFIEMRDVSDREIDLAKKWLDDFRNNTSIKPLARPKIGGISSFLQQLISYFEILLVHFKHRMTTGSDRKIPGAKVTLHLERYIKELRNYGYYRIFMKFDQLTDEPFVLYGLHRQPESSIDVRGAFFDDQLTLIKQIVRSLPVTHKLYVKVHFSDVAGQSPSFYRKLSRFPGVRIIDPDVNSRELLSKAAVIVTNVGAMGQEGGYLGRPVIAMSKMFWCDLPTVAYCGRPAELPNLINKMIKDPPVDDYRRVVQAIAGYLASSFSCDPNLGFMNPRFTANELNNLSEAYNHVYRLFMEKKGSF